MSSTPARDGFRMPAEFEGHERCYMVWPERPDNWREDAGPAQAAFAAVAAAIAPSEPVTMLASPAQTEQARAQLPAGVDVLEAVSDDAWARDIGPTFVIDDHGDRRAVDWIFNAWGGAKGGLYSSWANDDQIAAQIAEFEGCGRYQAPFVLEGGAIHTDGQGTLFTTAECLLNGNRNPTMTKAQLEAELRAFTGARKVIWLPFGVHGDETDGHIDNLLHVVAPGVVALTWTDDETDPQHARSAAALEVLRTTPDAHDRAIEVHLLPVPRPAPITAQEAAGVTATPGSKPRLAGETLAGSYANFYIGNSRVVMPLLDERADTDAQAVLEGLFPSREVIGVPSREILLGGGNVHCITQQVPTA